MAEQGLPSVTTVTQEAGIEQYVDIGKSSGDSDDFLRIKILPRNGTSTQFYFKDHDSDGLIDNLDGSTGTGETPLYVQIRFVKRRNNSISIEHSYETTDALYDTLIITAKFDGGKEGANYLQLGTKLINYSAAEFEETENFYFRVEYFGDSSSLLPYRDVDNGDPMFSNDFKIKTHEIAEESTSTIDPSYYTVSTEDVEEALQDPPNYYSVEDPDGVSSTFADLQKDICIKEPVVDEFGSFSNPDLKRICPTCIPNPSHTPLTWYEEPGVWLNEKTCNYTVRIKSEEPYSLIKDNPQRKERYIRKGITGILSYLNKQVIDQDICWNPPENASEECAPRISQNIINQYIEIYEVPTGENDGATFTVYRMNPSIFDDYQIRNPIALELFAKSTDIRPVSFDAPGVMSQGSKSYIKITVPANLIDLIPEDLLAQESEEAQEDLQDVEEVILEGPILVDPPPIVFT